MQFIHPFFGRVWYFYEPLETPKTLLFSVFSGWWYGFNSVQISYFAAWLSLYLTPSFSPYAPSRPQMLMLMLQNVFVVLIYHFGGVWGLLLMKHIFSNLKSNTDFGFPHQTMFSFFPTLLYWDEGDYFADLTNVGGFFQFFLGGESIFQRKKQMESCNLRWSPWNVLTHHKPVIHVCLGHSGVKLSNISKKLNGGA